MRGCKMKNSPMQNYSPSPFGERGVSPFAYWLGLTLKYFLKTSRKYFPSQKPVLSATSVTEYFPSFNSSAACFKRQEKARRKTGLSVLCFDKAKKKAPLLTLSLSGPVSRNGALRLVKRFFDPNTASALGRGVPRKISFS